MPGNIIHLTAEDIAAWPTPNYENPETRDYLPTFASVWFAAATIMVGLRSWVRLRRVGGELGLDDLFLFIGWLTGVMFTITAILVSEDALAKRHFWDIPPDNFSELALLVWLGEFGYLFGSCMVRISILLFYRRLVAGTFSKRWKIAVFVAIGFTVAWTLAFILALFLNCTPFEAYWKAFDPTYQKDFNCADTSVINALSGAFAIPGDLYAVGLPWAMTWKLQMPRRQKIALNAVFSLGLVVVAACGVRTYYTIQVSIKADVSSAIFDVFVWAQVELQLAMMAASAPALRVFFKHYLGSTWARSAQETCDTTSRPSRAKSPAFMQDSLQSKSEKDSRNRDPHCLDVEKEDAAFLTVRDKSSTGDQSHTPISLDVRDKFSMGDRSHTPTSDLDGPGMRPWSPTQAQGAGYEMNEMGGQSRAHHKRDSLATRGTEITWYESDSNASTRSRRFDE